MNQKDYSNIINMPHYVSKKYPQMSRKMRAAQFGRFAALEGYEDVISECDIEHIEKMNKKEE